LNLESLEMADMCSLERLLVVPGASAMPPLIYKRSMHFLGVGGRIGFARSKRPALKPLDERAQDIE